MRIITISYFLTLIYASKQFLECIWKMLEALLLRFIMCCSNCYDLHIYTMFGFYLLPVVCKGVHVLCVWLRIVVSSAQWPYQWHGGVLWKAGRTFLSWFTPGFCKVSCWSTFYLYVFCFLYWCAQCYQFLWIVRSWLPFRFSLIV